MTIGVGLIGYGMAGRAFHAPYICMASDMELKAVVSRDPSKVLADHPNMNVVPTVEALLSRPDMDLVVVASPDAFHVEHALAAIAAGKHVLVDKPLASNLADAHAVKTAAETQGVLLSVFHNRRWDADFLTLRRIIAEGILGDIVELESRSDRWAPQPSSLWRDARAGGSWYDFGAHLVDQAIVLFGRPSAISADIATLRAGAPATDYFNVTLQYPHRRVLLHSNKLAAQNGLRFAVHGTLGSWLKHGLDSQGPATYSGRLPAGEDWGVDPTPGLLTLGEDSQTSISVPNERGNYHEFWRELSQAIRGEAPNPVPVAEAITVMEVLEAGLLSAERHCEIPL